MTSRLVESIQKYGYIYTKGVPVAGIKCTPFRQMLPISLQPPTRLEIMPALYSNKQVKIDMPCVPEEPSTKGWQDHIKWFLNTTAIKVSQKVFVLLNLICDYIKNK